MDLNLTEYSPSDLMALKDKIDAEVADRIKQHGGAAMAFAALKTILDGHPDIACLHWSQYAPYFNDGEPCRFGLRYERMCYRALPDLTNVGMDVSVGSHKPLEEDKARFPYLRGPWTSRYPDDADHFEGTNPDGSKWEGDEVGISCWREDSPLAKSAAEAQRKVEDLADFLEKTLGDGVMVLVHRGGLLMREIDHD